MHRRLLSSAPAGPLMPTPASGPQGQPLLLSAPRQGEHGLPGADRAGPPAASAGLRRPSHHFHLRNQHETEL